MDEIKKYLRIAGVHSFWILSGFVLLSTVVVFYLTTTSLSQTIETRTKLLDSKFSEINQVNSAVPTHPNAISHKEMDKIFQELEEDVQKAWRVQYQNLESLLTWPKGAFSEEETRTIFANLRPIEKYVSFPIDEKDPKISRVTLNDREVYSKYIGPEFERIANIIGCKWKPKLGEKSGASMMTSNIPGQGNLAADANESPDLVRWAEPSQQELQRAIMPWYTPTSAPSVLEIYYAQEDLWLLTSIMKIIEKTNEGALENFQTVVREIEWIRMGKNASREVGTLSGGEAGNMGFGAGSMSGGGSGSMGSGGMSSGSGGMSSGSGGMSAGSGMTPTQGSGGTSSSGGVLTTVSMDPAEGRYISFAAGSEFKPRKAADLRDSIKNITAANAVDAIAKRVPIRMRLKVEQRRLHQLIAECSNAKMMLEVYQVRLNTDPAPGGGGGGAAGGAGSMSGGGSGGYSGGGGASGGAGQLGGRSLSGGGEGSSSSSGGMSMGGSAGTAVQDSPSVVSVEIFGLIYLYNPVNIGTLAEAKTTTEEPKPAPEASKVEPTVADNPENTPKEENTPPVEPPADPPANAETDPNSPDPNLNPPADTPENNPGAPPE